MDEESYEETITKYLSLTEEVQKTNQRLKDMLASELLITKNLNIVDENKEESEEKSVATATDEPETIVSDNNESLQNTITVSDVRIRNTTKFPLDQIDFNSSLDITKENGGILIVHTHTSESYTPTQQNNYEQTGTYRTTDNNYNVTKAGDELSELLKKYNFNVVQDKTSHDYPAYNGSYTRSASTMLRNLQEYQSTNIVIDLHRDALGSNPGFNPTVTIDGERAACLMFVIGTNGAGLEHPEWRENLKLAVQLQKKGDELYPGLFRPVRISDSRYNQQLSKGAFILEVGATGNTLEEAVASMKYFAKVMNEVIK